MVGLIAFYTVERLIHYEKSCLYANFYSLTCFVSISTEKQKNSSVSLIRQLQEQSKHGIMLCLETSFNHQKSSFIGTVDI
jgi:hypothetical protein